MNSGASGLNSGAAAAAWACSFMRVSLRFSLNIEELER
jgi:hypothetical protein